ncbi:hypothetical protein SOVF_051210 [Spinacia oleracea]|uniref:Glycosyltransferase n=1 Tax=Spinacia oleracea TaxID=3562 RepID=A0A9R0JYJ5_SPIOL|nr:scopoletin glucosyltransferase-like [Spinacia oleracea]KNA20580.1 hypothetical protein SOVF_051210 [Spinacia oleracea]
MADDEPQQVHVVFFPFMAYGHMNPTLDIAKLLADRGVKATIITTPHSLPIITKAVEENKVGSPTGTVYFELFKFPSTQCGLPEGCEIVNQAITIGMVPNFIKAVGMLKEQLEQYLEKTRPSCLVADMFLTWTTECAAKFNVPRVVFHGTCYFALCAQEIVRLSTPYKNATSDVEPFIIPSLPHEIKMTRLQISEDLRKEELTDAKKELDLIKESELNSYGVIVNSFYELEPDYADFFSKELGRRAWHIGPVSLCNRTSIKDKAQRGNSNDQDSSLKWLNSKQQDSVIYICFGSMTQFTVSQLHEIAVALEASKQDFIWFVKNDEDEKSQEWLPTGFKQRMEGKGLILRGWAPQLLILEHEAVGAFVTHCGWNSILEGITAGVPMVTWPGFAEQFYNEKLVTQVTKTGVSVGARICSMVPFIDDLVKRDAIEKALRDVMEGDEAREMRNRANKLKEMSHKAVEEGGSSYSSLGAFINELKASPCLTSLLL